MSAHFWVIVEALLADATIVIDRPRGSRHPRYPEIVYPLDYGYLSGTDGGDGDGIDVWIGSISGEKIVTAALATADRLKKNLEIKLLLNCTPEEIALIQHFFSEHKMGVVLLSRDHSSKA